MRAVQRFGSAPLPGGGRVAYAVTGSGPGLLVVPGWLSHLELGWAIPAERLFHEALSSGRTLVRYDRPGCGLSDEHRGPRTLELELAAVEAVLGAVDLPRVDVLGWSLGAAVAAQWAADRPETVARLVLYGGWASGSEVGDEDSRRLLLELLATHWGLGSDVLTELFAPEADAGTRLALAAYQRAASSTETAVALLRLAYSVDVRAVLPRVQAPRSSCTGAVTGRPRSPRPGSSRHRCRAPSWSSWRAARTCPRWVTRSRSWPRSDGSWACRRRAGRWRPGSPRASRRSRHSWRKA
ncbi:alpha/beta fold hydrolase [Phycicoccus sp. M110.8]|nr:alpha/beta fold hydrolase [Phycicoccus sp. M110.8]MDU0312272.1 alpha/beta fold hydrolase [Phycicoccus sp. M110.8]